MGSCSRLKSGGINPSYTPDGDPIFLEEAERDAQFVLESGQDEDQEAACLIQQTVTTKANTHLTFGYFEKAIVNFHQHLSKSLD